MEFNWITFWLIAGIALIIGEMISFSFFLLFVALGCFAAALLATMSSSFYAQAFVAALISILGILALRKPLQQKLAKSQTNISADLGKIVQIEAQVASQGQSRVTYQGVSWVIKNVGNEELIVADKAVIVGVDGNTLLVKKQ